MYLGRLNYEKGLNLIVEASKHFENEEILFILVGNSEINTFDLFKI